MELPRTEWVHASEAARRAGVVPSTMAIWVRKQVVAGFRLGRQICVYVDDLERLIEKRRAAEAKRRLLEFMRLGAAEHQGKLMKVMSPGGLCYRCTMETERPGMLCNWCAAESLGARYWAPRMIEPAMVSAAHGTLQLHYER